MRLYIANCTRQNRIVCYRLDFDQQGKPELRAQFQPAKQQPIDPGRQAMIGGDFHIRQIEDIVAQLARYGMVGVKDVATNKKMAPMVFNVDAPVPAEVMRRVSSSNAELLIEQGKMRRQRAAIRSNDLVNATVQKDLMDRGQMTEDTAPVDVDVGFEQLEQSDAGERRIEEGYKLRANAPPPKNAPKKPQRRK